MKKNFFSNWLIMLFLSFVSAVVGTLLFIKLTVIGLFPDLWFTTFLLLTLFFLLFNYLIVLDVSNKLFFSVNRFLVAFFISWFIAAFVSWLVNYPLFYAFFSLLAWFVGIWGFLLLVKWFVKKKNFW